MRVGIDAARRLRAKQDDGQTEELFAFAGLRVPAPIPACASSTLAQLAALTRRSRSAGESRRHAST